MNKLQLDLIEKKNVLGADLNKQGRFQDELAKVKMSIFENDYNMGKQESAIMKVEKMIKNNEIKDAQQLSDSYLKLSKWIYDFKDSKDQNSKKQPSLSQSMTDDDFKKAI